jgi:uncharacterized protein YbjT (DUF2867 family)
MRLERVEREGFRIESGASRQTTLVLGGTGRTGSLVARKLAERGLSARTASRHGADLPFDWDNPATHGPALAGVDRIYLVTPVMRVTYARLVSDFLDLAEAALTVAEVADIIAGVVGRPVRHNDIERGAWVDGATAAAVVPADYGVMLNWLTEMIASGRGSRPNDDVRRVTGSPPASFADFAHRNAHAWALPAARS